MKACVLFEPGPAENLKMVEVRDPGPPQEGELLLQVEASAIDGHDLVERQGVLTRGGQPVALTAAEELDIKENGVWVKKRGHILGHEIAGKVIAVGPGVTGFQVGDRVAPSGGTNCGVCDYCRTGLKVKCKNRLRRGLIGGYAELALVPAQAMMKIPEGISPVEASFVRCAIGTPLRGIMLAGQEPKFHDNILVCGAGGGLGIHALQIVALSGGFVMAATTSEHKVPLLKQYGASEVIFTPTGKFHEQVMELTDGDGADFVVDTVGGTTFNNGGFRALAYYGRYIFVGQINAEYARFPVPWLFWREAVITGATGGQYEDTLRSFELLKKKRIKAVVYETFKLEDTPRMHALLERRQIFGRAVIVFP
ncbi:MAG: alcohol dehydrogenase catalytic domain-containing protein [Chloroflexi bacterium]|nr:alcohol dehydrogenase catalytic domain-containing protein [Chloroflexota bacterium]